MKDALISILEQNGIKEWLLKIKRIDGAQGYYIRDKKEMLRYLDAVEIEVTVFRTFSEGDEKYRGSMAVAVSPSMNAKEIGAKLKLAFEGALSVKNRWYPLSDPESLKRKPAQTEFVLDGKSPAEWIGTIAGDIFETRGSKIVYNALEVSVVKNGITLVNSDGADYSWSDYSCFTELVTTAGKSSREEVEIFDLNYFSDYFREQVKRRVHLQSSHTLDRLKAGPITGIDVDGVVLSGKSLYEFFNYFAARAGSRMIFEGASTFGKGKRIQTGGDLVTIDVVPYIGGSDKNTPVDSDGIVPVPVRIVDKGIEDSAVADLQFGTYLGKEITGKCSNLSVAPGSMDRTSLENGKYLEAVEFSDFNMNPVTGDFGGELRLGYYFDGTNVIPVTGGSITGNMNNVIDSLRLSTKVITDRAYKGPDFLFIEGANIAV